ncbi:MAG TPA: hypothetical protein VM532_01910 [Burkholderiales bacterium]|nr:hypothetical protein [Burkholderiales bacterium]
MASQYPTNVFFLVAEDVRHEIGHKISIAGLFSGNDINVHVEPENPGVPVLPKLTIIGFVRDGAGKFAGKVRVLTPAGNDLISVHPVEFEKIEGQDAIIFIPIAPFVMTEFGKYEVSVMLDEKVYTHFFSVNSSQQQ